MNKITSTTDYFKSIKNQNVVIYFTHFDDISNIDVALEDLANDYTSLGVYFTSIDIDEFPLLHLPLSKPTNIPCFMFIKDGFEIGTTKGTNINIVEKIIQNCLLG
jgi:hypothetical protein